MDAKTWARLGGRIRTGARSTLTPARAVVLYIVTGLLWIALADPLAGALVGEAESHQRLHVALSWGFVGLTSLAMLALVRRALGALQFSERTLRATMQSLADPLLMVDLGGNVVDANRAALDMFGVQAKSELSMSLGRLAERFDIRYSDGSRIPPERHVSAAALRGEVENQYEALIRRADGGDRFITVSAAPVREHAGAPVRMAVVALHDIQHLKDLEKLRDDFLSIAAHELKTPVATIKGYAQLLQRSSSLPEDAVRALAVITRQCDRMDRMVRDLLELSRVTGARIHLSTEPLDLQRLAADAVDRMRLLARRHHIKMEGDEGGALVVVDRERIDQVLINLLDNAIKFSPNGGEIVVRVARSAQEVVLSVADSGIGIPIERQGRLFERFYQAHVGELRNPGGMGVGLYLARELLELHGGRIWFRTEPGSGTTFFVALPCVTRVAQGAVAGS